MMTLRRFKSLTDSYGADLQRWPEDERGAAAALLGSSAQARQRIAEALGLDEALGAASFQTDAALWPAGHADAALAWLRSSVGAEIAQPLYEQTAGTWLTRGATRWAHLVVSMQLGWPSLAASGGLAVVMGLLIGSSDIARPVPVNLLTMLQPSPIQVLSD